MSLTVEQIIRLRSLGYGTAEYNTYHDEIYGLTWWCYHCNCCIPWPTKDENSNGGYRLQCGVCGSYHVQQHATEYDPIEEYYKMKAWAWGSDNDIEDMRIPMKQRHKR